MLFGEVSSFKLKVKNEGKESLDGVELMSCDYLLTGFTSKVIDETIESGETKTIDMVIRGTKLSKDVSIPILIILKQKETVTFRVMVLELEIVNSFTITCFPNDVGFDRKFISFDLSNHVYNELLEEVFFRDIILISSVWEIDEDSIQRVNEGKVKLLNFVIKLKEGLEKEGEEYNRVRKDRKVELSDQIVRYENNPLLGEEDIQSNVGLGPIVGFLK